MMEHTPDSTAFPPDHAVSSPDQAVSPENSVANLSLLHAWTLTLCTVGMVYGEPLRVSWAILTMVCLELMNAGLGFWLGIINPKYRPLDKADMTADAIFAAAGVAVFALMLWFQLPGLLIRIVFGLGAIITIAFRDIFLNWFVAIPDELPG